MKGLITLVLAAQFLTVAAYAQTKTPSGSGIDIDLPAAASVNPVPQNPVVRILTPVDEEQFARTNNVDLRFDIVGPAAYTPTPNFLVQLDGEAPVRTTITQKTFSGLAPGAHSLTVQLVDANNAPISGSRAVTQFVIAPQHASASHSVTTEQEASLNVIPEVTEPEPPQLAQLGVQQSPPSEIMSVSSPLPSAGSALPLISVIGFGVLVGGIASAMKTR